MQIGSVNFENRGTEEVPIWYIPSSQEGTVKVTLSSVAPVVAYEGDFWFNESTGLLSVYNQSIGSWVQAGGSGGSITVSDNPPTDPAPKEGDLWYDDGSAALYVYYASPIGAWVQANGNGGGGQALKLREAIDSTLNGPVVIDHVANKVRIYENANPYRGGYIDLSQCSNYQGTNFIGSGGSSGESSQSHDVGIQSFYGDLSSVNFNLTLPFTYINNKRTFLVSIVGSWTNQCSFSVFSEAGRSGRIFLAVPFNPFDFGEIGADNVTIAYKPYPNILNTAGDNNSTLFNPNFNSNKTHVHFLLQNCSVSAMSFDVAGSGGMESICVTDLGSGVVNTPIPAGILASSLDGSSLYSDYYYNVAY